MDTDFEIKLLRLEERQTDMASRKLDAMSLKLLRWPHDTVVVMFLPACTWAYLPEGWQTMRELKLWLLRGVPPFKRDAAGRSAGVSVQTAELMIRMLERGYRG